MLGLVLGKTYHWVKYAILEKSLVVNVNKLFKIHPPKIYITTNIAINLGTNVIDISCICVTACKIAIEIPRNNAVNSIGETIVKISEIDSLPRLRIKVSPMSVKA